MRIPRDISGTDLVKLLSKFGYENTRQTGSHMRLTTQQNGEHNVTIPYHNPLRVGTLSAILADIANHFGLTKDELIRRLFER
ncbi:type II toxin-antitoxin system HicA family toxin [Pseudanabaena sp. FACHB-1998]|uniref:type II toxin-antitoxin system HicA family toxin n=1 Tax=Pseudanabaena sp. FACHB-1998 TaxID=2692858 RepID=UPI0016814E99|nr:type II toxin-antitoxin system HicA family toxin [Pseudanabaena sp. FACHB-1998]MBD2177141.1 type II toxin-antitoxin system HicA family toxin [Pseudanabaena sp. FACHB-1998]